MRLIPAFVLCCVALPSQAQLIQQDREQVRVETSRLITRFEQGALVGLESRLPGEVYERPSMDWTRRRSSYVHGLGVTRGDDFAELERIHAWYGSYPADSTLGTQLHPDEQPTLTGFSSASMKRRTPQLRETTPRCSVAARPIKEPAWMPLRGCPPFSHRR
jgi:hypothetical protein